MEQTKKKSRTSAKSVNKYIKNNYERVTILCKPLEAVEIRRKAEERGLTVTRFVLECVRKYMNDEPTSKN